LLTRCPIGQRLSAMEGQFLGLNLNVPGTVSLEILPTAALATATL